MTTTSSTGPTRSAFTLRAYTAAVIGALGIVLVTTAVVGGAPSWQTLLVLGVLVVLTEQRAVELPSGFTASAGLMIEMAAIVVFVVEGAVVGAVVVGALSALDLVHFRERRYVVVAMNAGVIGLATFAAAIVATFLPERWLTGMPYALIAAIPLTVCFVFVNSVLLSAYGTLAYGTSLRRLVADLVPASIQALPFGVVGALIGTLYLDLGPVIAVLMVVPVLVARQTFASYLEVRQANEAAVRVLVRALETKDRYTAGHTERVARFADLIGTELRLGPLRLERLRVAALMHDIGKLVVPNHLLNKPGPLTPEEYDRVRAHERVGHAMLARIDVLAPIARHALGDKRAAGRRHEMVEADILAVADAFDAMTSTRSYRRALAQDVAFAELRDKVGTQFDGACVEALVRAIERNGETYGAGHEADVTEWAVAPPQRGVGSAGLGDLDLSAVPIAAPDLTALDLEDLDDRRNAPSHVAHGLRDAEDAS